MIVVRHFRLTKIDQNAELDHRLAKIGKRFNYQCVLILDLAYDVDYEKMGREYNKLADKFIEWMSASFGAFDKNHGSWWVHKEHTGFLRVFVKDEKMATIIKLAWQPS
jgi:hypothetical protein